MNNYHGIIFAYKSYPELRELVAERTAASLPICSRYRLIDFALSSMRNAGIDPIPNPQSPIYFRFSKKN